MRLTQKQIKQLRMSRDLRERNPTLGWYIRGVWRYYLAILVFFLAVICFYTWAGWPLASAFVAGMLTAVLLRDLKWYRQMARGWPLSREITNWERVDELLAESDRPAP